MRSRLGPTDVYRVGRDSFPVFPEVRIGYTTMGRLLHANLTLLVVASLASFALTIPTSLVDQIKYNEIRNNKGQYSHVTELTKLFYVLKILNNIFRGGLDYFFIWKFYIKFYMTLPSHIFYIITFLTKLYGN